MDFCSCSLASSSCLILSVSDVKPAQRMAVSPSSGTLLTAEDDWMGVGSG